MRCATILNCTQNPLSLKHLGLSMLNYVICCRTSVLRNAISIKTSQDRCGSTSMLQANKWALGSEKKFILDQKSAEHVGACYKS